jgi:hypothetical protein
MGIIEAAANLGRDGNGAGGVTGYLEYLGRHHPKAFSHLLGKVLPLTVRAEGLSGTVIGAVNVISVPCDHYLSAQDIERLRAPALQQLEHAPEPVEPV